ncbi:zinc ribbon domain-containing protein [Alkalihalobacillus sp. FSL R5-0424]
MYCKQCGTKNAAGSLYCQHDGVELETSVKETKSPILSSQKLAHCTACSHSITSDALYCTHCGMSMEKVESVSHQSQPIHTPNAAPVQRTSEPISILKLAIYPVVALIVLSILSAMVAGLFNQILADELFGMGSLGVSIFSFLDILLILHFVSTVFSVDGGFIDVSLVMQGGFILYLIVPALVFTVIGLLLGRKTRGIPPVKLTRTIVIPAAIYSLLLAVLSLFASRSIEVMDGGFVSVSATASYGFFSAIIHAFVISALFMLIGLTISRKFYEFSYLAAFKRAMIHSALCVALLLGVAGLTTASDSGSGDAGTPVVATQLAAYYWNVSHFLTISADVNADYESYSISYNALTGAKSSIGDESQEEDINEIAGMARILFIVPLIAHGLAGFFWIAKQQVPLRRSIGAYAISAGLIHMIFIWLSSFSIYFLSNTADIGASALLGFIFTTVMAGAAAWVGYQVKQKFFA